MTRKLLEVRSAIVPATVTPASVNCERRAIGTLEVRTDDSKGPEGADFWGTLLPFMTVDSYRTLFAPDAFRDGGVDADPYALLWMHDPWTVAGQFEAEVRETGIWIAGAYDDTPEGSSARARGKSGSARGLSIGFERYADEDNEDGTTTITKARMVEGSQITTRMESVPGAGLAGVRATGRPEPVKVPTADELLAVRTRLMLSGG
jgi:uncharacterized protein